MSVESLRPLQPTPLIEALDRLYRLVSPLTGIVRRLYEPMCGPVEPPLVRLAAEPTQGRELVGVPLDHLREGTGGAGLSREAAVAAAIGEAAERYAASYVPLDRCLLASAGELGEQAVPPERFALFHRRQYAETSFPFEPFKAETRVSWVPGFSIPDGRPVYLPTQLVYLRDPRRIFGETPIGYATSNGLACAPTLEEAVLEGLLEAMERDAFLLTWYGRLSLPRLDWSDDDRMVELERRYFAPTRLSYAVIDLSVFHEVPTALGVVRGSAPCGALAVGAACRPTIQEAWRKALAEAFAVEAWARALLHRQPTRGFREDFDDVRTFADHVRLYAGAEQAGRACFLDAADQTRAVSEVEQVLGTNVAELIEALAARLETVGERAYAVDVTSPDVRAAGLSVAKVIVPGLCQLDADHRFRFLGSPRLRTAAWRAGLRSRPHAWEALNHDPHPFP